MDIRAVVSDKAPASIGPYSQAIIASGIIFCAGQLPLDPQTGELVENDIAMQTRRVLQNHAAVLAAAGSDLMHVVRTNVYLRDLADFSAMNAEYEQWFGPRPPARTTVGVADLPRGARLSIECTAVLP